jgi:single-stranded DNA-binding protein
MALARWSVTVPGVCGLGPHADEFAVVRERRSIAVQLNKGVLIGRIGERGVTVTYSDQAVPTCSLTLEVDEVSPGGKVFTTCLPVESVGKYAEDVAHSLEPGDEVLVDATLKYRRLIDNKTGENASQWVVSGWTVTKALSALVNAAGNSHTEPSR